MLDKGMLSAVLLSACLAAGCVSVPVPEDALTRAELAINHADTAGAEQYAQQPLDAARKSLAMARELSQANRNHQARYAAQTAQAHAELAQALALAEQADQRAEQAENDLARVRNDILRQQGPAQ